MAKRSGPALDASEWSAEGRRSPPAGWLADCSVKGMSIDRSEVARALAKAIAYKQCGKDREAAEWAARLVRLLECAEILDSRF
jgi:hypothetical protein